MEYDYLIVGSGLAGAVVAYRASQAGKKVLVIDKRSVIAGNCYEDYFQDMPVSNHGPHIFHTNDDEVWKFVTSFCEFRHCVYSPMAYGADKRFYNLPFNMNTFYHIYGTHDPVEVSKEFGSREVNSLEDLAINTVGEKAYNLLVKHYTERQWGKPCNELPPEILGRIPVRFEWDNNYFNCKYQGFPILGYTYLIEKLLRGVEVRLKTPYTNDMYNLADKIVYCGTLDELLDFKFGKLPYRTLSIFIAVLSDDTCGFSALNNCSPNGIWSRSVDYTKLYKWKFKKDYKVISVEFPGEHEHEEQERYYPIPTFQNIELYNKYVDEVSRVYPKVIPFGRLGLYKYLDMDQVIEKALKFPI